MTGKRIWRDVGRRRVNGRTECSIRVCYRLRLTSKGQYIDPLKDLICSFNLTSRNVSRVTTPIPSGRLQIHAPPSNPSISFFSCSPTPPSPHMQTHFPPSQDVVHETPYSPLLSLGNGSSPCSRVFASLISQMCEIRDSAAVT